MVRNGDEKGFTCFHVSLCPSRSSVSLPAFKGQSKCGKSCGKSNSQSERVSKDYTYTYLAIIKEEDSEKDKGEVDIQLQPGDSEKLHRGGVLGGGS